jgi:hypothetical protein
MLKSKTVLVTSVTLLFIALSFNPAIANLSLEKNPGFVNKKCEYTLSESEMKEIDELLCKLMEEMEKAMCYADLIETINNFKTTANHPFITLLLKAIMGYLSLTQEITKLRPLKKRVFIISCGSTNQLISLRPNRIKLFYPFTFWFYSDGLAPLLESKTIILDLLPFNIKTLTGRQFGFMKRFIGLYVYLHSDVTDKSYTVFFGHAARVRGFDLSPPII